MYTKRCRDVQNYVEMYKKMQVCTKRCRDVQNYVEMYKKMQGCTKRCIVHCTVLYGCTTTNEAISKITLKHEGCVQYKKVRKHKNRGIEKQLGTNKK